MTNAVRTLTRITTLLAVLVAVAVTPAAASADYREIFRDCGDGKLDKTYSQKELSQAANELDALGDYNDCADAIAIAQTGGGKKGGSGNGGNGSGSGSGGGGSTGGGATGGSGGAGTGTGGDATGSTTPTTPEPTPQESADAARAATEIATNAADGSQIDLKNVKVPESSLDLGQSGASLPTPLLLALIASGGAACVAGGAAGLQALRRRRGR